MDRQYRTEIAYYTTNQRIIANCNVITFVNNSPFTIYVNNFPITSGNNLSIAGNNDEIDVTEYLIDFQGATNGQVYIIKKINQ